ncbi:type I polyketide synthase [Nocardia terpenica]|uniref:type I polyketide synthase n=1 Tax=Nocardia terpenica TaxID=455432 RepID=UPI001C1E5B0B|nr:type I polyketide synthase [Nocardia terpenica]
MTAPAPEPPSVSIIGIGCRVPGAAGVEQFWDVLLEGRDARAAVADGERARLEPNGLHAFDNGFFGISDRDAAAMDPRERVCLEVAVEALDDAGVGHRVRGSRTAVIVAVGGEHRTATGQAGAPGGLAERLSAALDLRGPLAMLDGGCSSSLAAVAAAVRALAADEAGLAIVGGVNLALPPHFSIDEPAFDPRAVETVNACHRDDGCAVLILQRTADARHEGNRIYAEIAGVAVGSADRSSLLASDGQQVVRTAWARAGFAPRDAGLFECHGNGALFAEPSIDAVAAALARDRDPADKTWIGSATSAVGRPGAAAAITGIAKAALCIRHGIIAPTVGFPDRRPRLGEFGLHVPTEPIGWQDVPLPDRRAGIDSSGCGAAAHIVLHGPTRTTPPRATDPPFLLPLSARDETELRTRAAHWATLLSQSPATLREFTTAAARLLPQEARSTIIARNVPDAITHLCFLAAPLSPCTTATPPAPAAPTLAPTRPKESGGGVLFLFSAEGGEYSRMGRGLAARYPVFARGVAEGADAVVRAGGPRVWTPRHGFGHGLDCAEVVQPALFVYQVALAELLGAWGIRPDAVAGYGLGEVAAAVASGALSVAEGARVAVARGRALARMDGPVATAVLAVSPEQAWRLVEPMRAEVSIAAIHGAESVVVAGVPNYVETVLRRAGRRGMSWHRVVDDPAAYGPEVRAVRDEFVTVLGDLDPRAAERRLYSTTLGRPLDNRERVDADYWADNLCGAVDVASALDSAAADGISTVIEVSPRAVLATLVRQHSSFRASAHALTGENEAVSFLDVVAGLYLEGRAIDWAAQGEFTGVSVERLWRRSIFPQIAPAEVRRRAKPRPVDIALPDRSPVPTAFWLRRLLWVAAGTRLTDFTVHGRVDAAVLPDVGFRAGSRVLAAFGQVPLASGRIAAAPTPADIVAWLRTVDAHRSHRDPENHSAIGLFGYIPLDTAAVDACLRLIATAAADLLPPDRWPFPVGIASAWLDDTAGLLLTEAHAFVRAAHPGELLSDVIAIDQHGAPAVALLGVRSALDTADREHASQSDIVQPTGIVYRIRETATGYAWDAVDALPDDLLPIGETPRTEARPLLLAETWTPLAVPAASEAHSDARFQRALVVGASEAAAALGAELGRRLPTERIARDPAAADSLIASLLAGRREPTAVVLVWPDGRPEGPIVEQARRALAVLQRIRGSAATALTVVLPDRDAIAQHAVAGLVRSLRRESPHPTRLIWLTGHDPGPALDLVMNPAGPQEVRIADGRVSARRFEPVAPAESAIGLSANGTYVVTGGLGRLGAIAVRWLLDAGAHDVVVLTRTPRPLPALLAGLEDRIVVVRCDVTDRADLANALDDVRECGSVIRGFVHAAGIRRDADFAATTPDLLTALFRPTLVAAAALLDLTATDPIDVGLLFSSTLGALGGPGQAAYAAAHAALQALARTRGRGTICIGWGRTESTPPEAEPGSSLAAGTVDPAHGRAVLTEILRHRDPLLLAPDDDPTPALDPPCRPFGCDGSAGSRPKACRDQGEPPRHVGNGELHAAQGKPHVRLDRGEAHTHPGQGEPHMHLDQGEAHTHPDQGEPRTHRKQGEPHMDPSQGRSQTRLDQADSGRGGAAHDSLHSGPRHNSFQGGATHNSPHSGTTHNPLHGGATHNAPHGGATHNAPHSGTTHNAPHSGTTHNSLQGGGVHGSGRSEAGGVREGEVVVGAVGRIIRAALAVMLERRVELLDPRADFGALGVSRAQMGELRRTLEARLGLVLGDSDIGDHSTVAALGAELSARMRAAHPLEESP